MKINLGMGYRCFIICLVLSLCTSLSISVDVFVNIDCGSSAPLDVQSGKSRTVNSVPLEAGKMRVFINQNNKCYNNFHVHASFYLDDYDGKSPPPTVAIHFNSYRWTNVQASTSPYYEMTYNMTRDSISICVAPTQLISNTTHSHSYEDDPYWECMQITMTRMSILKWLLTVVILFITMVILG